MAGKPVNPDCQNCTCKPNILFKELTNEDIAVLSMNKTCRRYKKGQNLFFEGQHPSGLYCIHQGKIKLYKTSYEGREQIVRLCKAGEVLGYRALISDKPYAASASTLEESLVCQIPRDEFFKQIEKNPKVALSLIRTLSQELRNAEDRMMNLAQKSVRERLAETLIILKETYGLDEESVLSITLSREDLANIVGTATETVIRLLAEFKKEELIDTKGKRIKLKDEKGLLRAGNVVD